MLAQLLREWLWSRDPHPCERSPRLAVPGVWTTACYCANWRSCCGRPLSVVTVLNRAVCDHVMLLVSHTVCTFVQYSACWPHSTAVVALALNQALLFVLPPLPSSPRLPALGQREGMMEEEVGRLRASMESLMVRFVSLQHEAATAKAKVTVQETAIERLIAAGRKEQVRILLFCSVSFLCFVVRSPSFSVSLYFLLTLSSWAQFVRLCVPLSAFEPFLSYTYSSLQPTVPGPAPISYIPIFCISASHFSNVLTV